MFREVLAATIILTTATVSAAVASPHGEGKHHGEHRGKAGMGRALRQLDLSDAQKQAIRDLMEREREASAGLRESFRAKAQEYRQLKQANDPRAESVKAELQPMKDQLKARHEALRAEIDKILTPEQRQKLQEQKSRRDRNRG